MEHGYLCLFVYMCFHVFSYVYVSGYLPAWPVTEKARCLLAIATLGVNCIFIGNYMAFILPYLPIRVSVKHRPG